MYSPLFIREDIDRSRKTASTSYKPQKPAAIL